MTDFYTDNLVLQIAEIKDDLYARLKEARSKANEPFPDWYNPHDFDSGLVHAERYCAKAEIEFLSDLLDRIERS
mgnify:CR=1 FL=1